MKKRQYQVKIPQFINKDKLQLSTKQANESRLVTCMFPMKNFF